MPKLGLGTNTRYFVPLFNTQGNALNATLQGIYTDAVEIWTMDEVSGVRAGLKGAHTLLDENTVGSTTGLLNNAAVFVKANSERLRLPNTADFNVETTDFSFTGWFKTPSSISTDEGILGAFGGTAGTSYYGLFMNSSLDLTWRIYGSGISDATITTLSANTWYHFYCERISSTQAQRVRINDTTEATDAGRAISTGITPDLVVGALSISTFLSSFTIDQTLFIRRTLTDAEITADYNSGAPVDWSAYA